MPKFTTDFPGAVIREGADELTLRVHEESALRTFMDTSTVGDQRWGASASRRGLARRVGSHVLPLQGNAPGGEKARNLEKTKKAKVLWTMKEAKDKGVDFYHTNHQKEIRTRAQFRLNLWAIHLKNPTAALAKALECLDQGESAPSATTVVRSFGLSALPLPSAGWKVLPQTLRTAGPFSGEDGEDNVEHFVLCSFATCTCSPLTRRRAVQGGLDVSLPRWTRHSSVRTER